MGVHFGALGCKGKSCNKQLKKAKMTTLVKTLLVCLACIALHVALTVSVCLQCYEVWFTWAAQALMVILITCCLYMAAKYK